MSRDPKRIKPFCDELAKCWEEMPNLRFGQLLYELANKIGRDIFFPEENEWLEKIKDLRINNNYIKRGDDHFNE